MNVAIVDIGNGVAQTRSGKMRSIAIAAQARYAGAPNVPMLEEALTNVGVTMETIIAIAAPAGTPSTVVQAMDKAFLEALEKPEVKARYATRNTSLLPLSTGGLVQCLKSDNLKWKALIWRAGIEQGEVRCHSGECSARLPDRAPHQFIPPKALTAYASRFTVRPQLFLERRAHFSIKFSRK